MAKKKKVLTMDVVQRPISSIKPYWRNARINEETIEPLKESIKRYGFNVPIVIDKDSVIIAGHARYKALMQEGYEEVPCIVKTDLSDKQVKEYRIADNKIGEIAFWDEQDLIPELRELGAEQMQYAFPDQDLSFMLYESVGQEIKPVAKADVDGKTEKLNSQFSDAVQKDDDRKFECTCPECGESFYINKDDVR